LIRLDGMKEKLLGFFHVNRPRQNAQKGGGFFLGR